MPQVINGSYDKVKVAELDALASETAAYLATEHPDYSLLAGRISVSALHKVGCQKPHKSCLFACAPVTILALAGHRSFLLENDQDSA
jgi:hypothetical protein